MRNVLLKIDSQIGLVLAIYLFFFYQIFSPAFLDPSTRMIGMPGDVYGMLFIFGWFSKASSWLSPTLVTDAFYPIGIDMSAFWEGTIWWYLGGILSLVLPKVTSYNLIVFLVFTLNFLSSWFVFSKCSTSKLFSGGLAISFSLSSFFIARSLGHLNIACVFPLIWFIYFLTQPISDSNHRVNRTGVVLSTTLCSICSWYIFVMAICVALILIPTLLMRSYSNGGLRRTVNSLFWIGAISGLLIVAFNYPMFRAFFSGSEYFKPYPISEDQSGIREMFSMTLKEYVQPPILNDFYKGSENIQGNIEKVIFPGWPTYLLFFLAILVLGARSELLRCMPILLAGILCFALSMGMNSPFGIYDLFTRVPLISTARVPSRFEIVPIYIGLLISSVAWGVVKSNFMRGIMCLLLLSQLFITAQFRPAFCDLSAYLPLERLRSESHPPILVLPLSSGEPSVGLVPAFSGSPVFSGSAGHSNASPQLLHVLLSNLLIKLGTAEFDQKDIVAEPSDAQTLYYLSRKYGVATVLRIRDRSITEKAKALLAILGSAEPMGAYDQYSLPKNIELGNQLFIVTSRGIGALEKGRRSVFHRFEIDLVNPGSEKVHVTLHLTFEPVVEGAGLRRDGRLIDPKSIDLVLTPGVNSLKFETDLACKIMQNDCIAGWLSEIKVAVVS